MIMGSFGRYLPQSTHDHGTGRERLAQTKALTPVMARPTISVLISRVPS
jgi:hypothetical protein